MDRTVLPGNDFYAYANGAGAKATAIPADKSNYGMFTVLADLSQQRTRDILEAAKSDPNSKIGRAYTADLDAGAVEAKGMAQNETWLNRVRRVDKAGVEGRVAEADSKRVSHLFGGRDGEDDKTPHDSY